MGPEVFGPACPSSQVPATDRRWHPAPPMTRWGLGRRSRSRLVEFHAGTRLSKAAGACWCSSITTPTVARPRLLTNPRRIERPVLEVAWLESRNRPGDRALPPRADRRPEADGAGSQASSHIRTAEDVRRRQCQKPESRVGRRGPHYEACLPAPPRCQRPGVSVIPTGCRERHRGRSYRPQPRAACGLHPYRENAVASTSR